MTELLTAAQMRAIEEAAMASGQVTGLELMERAGQGVVNAILEEWPDYRSAPASASVFCGPGNNGGDGFVVARRLAARGWDVTVWFWGKAEALPPDAKANHDAWAAIGPVHTLDQAAFRAAPATSLYIDALFGIGLSRPISGELRDFVRYLAGSGGDYAHFQPRMVAVDVPSGLCADSGRVLGCGDPDIFDPAAPFARLTVTFDSPKIGHFLAHGPRLCGRLVVANIGLEHWRVRETGPDAKPNIARLPLVELFPPRPEIRDSRDFMRLSPADHLRKFSGHKYTHGHVLVVAGPAGHTGAARLAARAALRVGAGLVTLAVPSGAMAECAAQLTAIMLRRCDGPEDLTDILSDKRFNALCLGPGLGQAARALTLAALAARPKGTYASPLHIVLDADALTAFADDPDTLFGALDDKVVLTPHGGEFSRLWPDIAARLNAPEPPPPLTHAAYDPTRFQDHQAALRRFQNALETQSGPAFSRLDATREASLSAGCTVLLKGADTVISSPVGTRRGTGESIAKASLHAAVYEREAPWLATAGSGDVLAGLIAGLMARGAFPHAAAETAAWLHVEAARRFGPGLIAEDLPEQLPGVFRDLGL